MLVLALDTSTALTTVALVASGGDVLAESSHLDARRHAEMLPRLVRDVLASSGSKPADLGLLAVGVGPGPFTGLRVGVAFARAAAHAREIPVVGAMSLDVIARARQQEGPFTVVTRSRRVEVAWAAYDGSGRRIDGPLIQPDPGYPRRGLVVGDVEGVDVVARPCASDLAVLVQERVASGESLPDDREWPEDAADGSGLPTAALLADLASQERWLLPALPLYLRRPDAVPA